MSAVWEFLAKAAALGFLFLIWKTFVIVSTDSNLIQDPHFKVMPRFDSKAEWNYWKQFFYPLEMKYTADGVLTFNNRY